MNQSDTDTETDTNRRATNQPKVRSQLKYWTLAWLLTYAAAAFLPGLVWDFAPLPTVAIVLLNLVIGFGMIRVNGRYLQSLDELQQKIFLDACAFTLGVGLIAGLGYELLEDIKLITHEPEISHLVVLMCITFLIAMINGNRRYA